MAHDPRSQVRPRSQREEGVGDSEGAPPTVSIVINNYNYARFLPDAIDSALAQTYPHVEVIVVDDGSTDDSRTVIARYPDRVTPVLQANGGQSASINAGFARGKGDLFIFLDADDILVETTAERVANRFRSQPELSKIQYLMAVIDVAGRRTGEIRPRAHLLRAEGDVRHREVNGPFDMTWTAMSANAFSRHALEHVLPIPDQVYRPTGSDVYLAHLTPFYGPIAFLDEVGAFYRIHGRNSFASLELDLNSVRDGIDLMRKTLMYIGQTARSQGLLTSPPGPDEIPSFAYVANRLISLRLDPSHHPIREDSIPGLLRLGLTALRRRFDVGLSVKVALFGWLVAEALAPRPFAWLLAEQMLFPERRLAWINDALGRAHRRQARASAAQVPAEVSYAARARGDSAGLRPRS